MSEIKKWKFEEELIAMAVSCIGLKETTAKTKARKIFNKYDAIISHSTEDMDWYKNKYERLQRMFDALKTGKITYCREETKGVVLIRDIEQVEVTKSNTIITTKSGREIKFSQDFEYLKEII